MTAKQIGFLEVLRISQIRAAVVCKMCCLARFGPLKTEKDSKPPRLEGKLVCEGRCDSLTHIYHFAFLLTP